MSESREYADLNSPEKMKEEIAWYMERMQAQNETLDGLMKDLEESQDPEKAKKVFEQIEQIAKIQKEAASTLEHVEGMLASEEQKQKMETYKAARDAWFEVESDLSAAVNDLANVGEDEARAKELMDTIRKLEVSRHDQGKAAMRSLGELQQAA